MKRWAIGCIGIVLLSSVAFSQGIEGRGIKGGLAIATIRGDDVKDAKSKIGGAIGGFLTYRLNEQIVIQPELLFVMKGAKQESTSGSPTVTVKLTSSLNYLEIPVLVKFSIPTQGNIKPSIFAGPSLGILLSAKCKTNGVKTDMKDKVKGTDIGLVLGGGIDFPLQTYKLTADIRYTLGLTTTNKATGGQKELDVKNGVISIMAGCLF